MPVLGAIRERFVREKPLSGLTIGMALHVEAKTANLVETLAAGGASVHITGCNPLSTQDDVASALDRVDGVRCYAKRGASTEEYYEAIDHVLDARPQITIDDGMDLIFHLHTKRTDQLDGILGGCEGDHHRCPQAPRDGGGYKTPLPRCCGERYPHETFL